MSGTRWEQQWSYEYSTSLQILHYIIKGMCVHTSQCAMSSTIVTLLLICKIQVDITGI